MSRAFLILFMAVYLPSVTWANSCEDALSLRAQRLDEIFAFFRELGLTNLVESFDQDLVQVSYSDKQFRWQKEIGWKTSLIKGRRQLIIRNLTWSDEGQKQLAIWRVADALYRLELDKSLWSVRAMFPTSGTMGSYNLASTWRDARLAKVNALEGELYTLLENLPELDPGKILPRHDPGRWSIANLALLRDTVQRVGPNQQDFHLRQTQGQESVDLRNNHRYSRATLFNYYLDWAKRVVIVGAVTVGGVWLAPPTYVYVESLMRQPLTPAQQLSPQQQKQALERAIREEESKVLNPDTKKIEALKLRYRELLENNPNI